MKRIIFSCGLVLSALIGGMLSIAVLTDSGYGWGHRGKMRSIAGIAQAGGSPIGGAGTLNTGGILYATDASTAATDIVLNWDNVNKKIHLGTGSSHIGMFIDAAAGNFNSFVDLGQNGSAKSNLYWDGANQRTVVSDKATTPVVLAPTGGTVQFGSATQWTEGNSQFSTTAETVLSRDTQGGNVLALANISNPNTNGTGRADSVATFRDYLQTEFGAIGYHQLKTGTNDTFGPALFWETSSKTTTALPIRFVSTNANSPSLMVQMNLADTVIFNHLRGGTTCPTNATCAATAPSISSGFGSSPSIAGSDNAGRITVGSGGSANTGVIAFGRTWTTAPACSVSDESTVLLVQSRATATQLTLTGASAFGSGDVLAYTCIGY